MRRATGCGRAGGFEDRRDTAGEAHSEYSTVISWRENWKLSQASLITPGFTGFPSIFDIAAAYQFVCPFGASLMSLLSSSRPRSPSSSRRRPP